MTRVSSAELNPSLDFGPAILFSSEFVTQQGYRFIHCSRGSTSSSPHCPVRHGLAHTPSEKENPPQSLLTSPANEV